ncbi:MULTISPECIES: type III secretion system outer membrane ring subunit SctC [Pseudomonas]|uniref:type III secretion system outer membrane ring subunit SctC n=1 Tax=Pseudomonas TaxID=286 RepID=UPI000CFCEBF7|nr:MULTISPECIES: type III secretion system outer membrane ring subunit SctC [Pseudomonas]PQZ90749.1 EscC/YscC/HrcC family type III secretion system outer membrane ring protein [Pseudomonas trivialis]PRB25982.1 EscC/YscC/HrcC family type III secretion system outer membrane ring protein [Pseudomonas sp. MYb60]
MVYADVPTLLLRHLPCRWLLFFVLLLGSVSAWGERHDAQDENLHTLFTALSLPLGLPVVVSRAVARKRHTGVLDLANPQQALEAVASQQDLIWYSDGQGIYLYNADEAKSSAVTLRHISVERFRGLMRRAGVDESRHPLRESGARTFYVSGPPNYVDQVLRLAQLMDRQRADLRVGSQSFAVVQVLNTPVTDYEYTLGGQTLSVSGIASLIDTLLAGEKKGLLADKSLGVIAYPDTNSLLIKGKPAQVRFIEQLVKELDVPKRAVEVSLWRVDVDGDELKKLEPDWADPAKGSITRVFEPLDDSRLMARITALEKRRRARVVVLPVILTQENVPAVFQDNHTFYLPSPEDERSDWKPVRYATQVSVLPRFAEAGQIEIRLDVEDGRQLSPTGRGEKPTAVGRIAVNSVARVPAGKRLWLGAFRRDAELRAPRAGRPAEVRLFVVQVRAVGSEVKALAGAIAPPSLTAEQYERVQRAFVRPGRDTSP